MRILLYADSFIHIRIIYLITDFKRADKRETFIEDFGNPSWHHYLITLLSQA